MKSEKNFILKYIYKNKKNVLIAMITLIALSVLNVIPGIIIKNIFDYGILKNKFRYVQKWCMFLLLIYIFKSMLNYYSNYIFVMFSENIVYEIRKDVSNKILKLPMEFFNLKESGYITSRINEVNNIGILFSVNTFKIILGFFELIGTIVILIKINTKLTIIMCTLMPIYFIICKKCINSISKTTEETVEKQAILSNKIQQSVQGIEEVKNLIGEDIELDKIEKANKELIDSSIKQSISCSIGTEFVILLGLISMVLLVYVGGKSVISRSLTIGGYIAFTTYLPNLYSPIQQLSVISLSIQPALVSIKRLDSFMKELSEEDFDKSKQKIDSINNIKIENIYFRYCKEKEFILNNLNFNVNHKDKIMIRGKNGAGKTTLLRLLIGLYDLDKGNIYINGIDIYNIKKKSIRSRIGIVSQKVYLFNGTIKENIKYGLTCFDEERYNKILKITGISEIIDKLPEKSNTLIGENGANLSGGQIQRIAIARALLKDPDVFLFDEMTSNLDNHIIPIIKNIVSQQLNNKICIFIEHKDDFDNICNKTIHI